LDLLANEQLWNSLTQFDAPTAGSHLAIRQLVQSWNLTHYVRGSFLPLGENLILSWHLHTVATGELISFSVRRALIAGILTAVDETAPRLEEELGVVGLDVYLPPAEALLSGSMEALQAYYQGLNYYRAAAFASAYGSLQQAVKHDNQFCLAHYYLAKSARLAEQPGYDTAIDQALDLSGRVGTYERLLIAVEKATIDQDISAQVRIAEELVRNYPQEKQGYLSLAEAYQWRGENDRAQVIFQQALELDPRLLVTGTAAGLGITSLLENYLDTNNLETAEQLLKQTILPNYSQHTGHQALGVVQYYRGVYAEANSAFMQAAERNRTAYAYPQIWQARVMLQERNFAAAMALLTNVIGRMASDDPLRGWYRWQLAEIKREQGQIQAWWAMVNDLGLTSPLLADTGFAPSYWEGYYHEQLGRYEQALNCYQQIYQQLRDNLPKMPLPSTRLRLAWAQCHYARLLAVQGKLDDVRLLIEQMHQDDQQFPHPKAERLALFLSGVLASQQGNYEMAIGLLRRSIWSQTNGFAMAIKLLAQCLRQTQEYDRALRLWQKLRPHGTLRSAAAFYLNTQVHLEIAKIYEASGQRTIALQHYRECMQVWASADKDFVSYQEAQAGVALLT
jgi:tetratricopeptide (TPR) repeat protein